MVAGASGAEATAPMSPLLRLSAREAVSRLRARELTPRQLVDACAARLGAHDAVVNAVPILCLESAREAADRLEREGFPDDASARPGYLYGLPVVVKDTMPVEGVRFTNGSALVDCVAARSDLTVRILEANGAICLGKSNTPEFAAGSNTFNALFGATVNPFDTRMTCGGSSGGSGAALAAGMCFGATGSDLGGSLRIPASFCGVVGLRPAPGRVPRGPVASPLDRLAVNGPMGRDVLDTALMLDAMVAPAGGEGEGEGAAAMVMADPLALPAPRESFAAAAARAAPPARVAWSRDLGGISPVEPEVADVCERAARLFSSELGASVEDACVDLSDAEALFRTLRADGMARTFEEVVADPEKRAILKPDLLWNIDYGLKEQSAADVRAAQRAHVALIYRAAAFFEEYDVLATPCVMTAPFDVNVPWLKEVAGVELSNYTEWLRMTYAVTLTECPALSLPCGYTESGLPVGLQLVGKPRGEAALLGAAAALEGVLGVRADVPLDAPRGRAAGPT